MSERVITSEPIDSRKKKFDAEDVNFLAGLIMGFALALLFGAISFWYFGDLFSQAEQPLSPYGEDGFWRPMNERTVPRTPENVRGVN